MPTPFPPPPTATPTLAATPQPPERGRPGQLTFGWRVATVGMWALVFVAFTGVWKASRELGLSTWWLGPFGEPQPIFVIVVPFALPAALIVAALNNARGLPWLGVGAGAVTAAIGIADLDRVTRLGVVEIAIGAAAVAFSIATASGRYRRAWRRVLTLLMRPPSAWRRRRAEPGHPSRNDAADLMTSPS